MALTTPGSSRRLIGSPALRPSSWLELDVLSVLGVAVVALVLALVTVSHNLGPVPTVLRGGFAGLLLFAVCGFALALALVPAEWGALVVLSSVPLGAASSGLGLTALGLAGVPLRVSLWLVLAAGLLAGVLVLRRRSTSRLATGRQDRRRLASWLAVLLLLFCVAMIPAWRTSQATVYGQNPDSQQVVGIAVLFQHVSPTATDVALPVDTVPPSWRFRYPIFYPLAAASNLSHLDPIRVFPAIAALLVAIAALGFGALGVRCLRAPRGAGPAIAAATGLSVVTLHLAWHPYWNQLWGLAMLPYALLFGWCALETLDLRLGALCALVLVMLALAYPLALPDPLVILAALAIAYRPRLRPIQALRSRSWIVGLVAVLLLAPAVIGAAVKLGQGISQFLSPHSTLWGGDVTSFLPLGWFVGTGGGILAALAVAAVALFALRALPRRVALALGLAVLALALVDVRFRLARSGSYMDFKQLSFVGALVVAIAAAGVARLGASRRGLALAGGLALAAGWTVAAAVQDRSEILATEAQVPPEMFQIRAWADRLPPTASVRVDIPPSGVQLWAVYMLGAHPVDSPTPVLSTTYAHAPFGVRAAYSLSLSHYPYAHGRLRRAYPTPAFAQDPPLEQNDEFALRRIGWPSRFREIPDTASQTLVEP